MIALLCFFLTLVASPFKSKSRLEAENAALRHQLAVLRARAREGECELGTLGIGKRCQERISATGLAVVADSSRNPLSTRSMWRATGADGAGFARRYWLSPTRQTRGLYKGGSTS